jgi:hypothetical protein
MADESGKQRKRQEFGVYAVFMQREMLSGQWGCHWAKLRLNPVNTGLSCVKTISR